MSTNTFGAIIWIYDLISKCIFQTQWLNTQQPNPNDLFPCAKDFLFIGKDLVILKPSLDSITWDSVI